MSVPLTPEQHISNLARGDAVHDFKDLGPTGKDTNNINKVEIFNRSVITPTSTYYSEKDLLNILLGGEPWERPAKEKADAKIRVDISGISYQITDFKIEDQKDTMLEGEELARRMGLPTQSAFVVDMNQHGIWERLKHGARTTATPNTIYHLLTPEVINDPAGKTPYTDSEFKKETGLNIVPCIEVRNTPLVFPGGQKFDVSQGPRSLFYTKYMTQLSPLEGVTNTTLPTKLKVSLSIKDTETNNTIVLKNSKESNAIEFIKNILVGIFRRFFPSPKTQFDVASLWLQKRSGDWLQAIAARDIRGRTFIDRDKNQASLDDNMPVYFVTHDQIACAYALMIGCNVIFISPQTTIPSFVFSREAAEPITYVIDEAKLTAQKSKLETKLTELEQELNALVPVFSFDAGKSAEQLNKDVQTLLTTMMKRTYIQEIRTQYQQLLNGLNGSDDQTKYTSIFYSEKVDPKPFSIKPFEGTFMYGKASTWAYSNDLPNRRTGKSPLNNAHYDFLVYIGTLNESNAKLQMAQAFAKLADDLKADPNENVQRGFANMSNRVHAHLDIAQLNANEVEISRILLDFSLAEVEHIGEAKRQREGEDIEERPTKKGGADEETLDIQISDVDRIMPIVQTLNTLGNDKIKNKAFLLSPILAIVYGLQGSIEKLEGSPDLAMYGRYLALVEYMVSRISSNTHRRIVWEFLTCPPDERRHIAELMGITEDEYNPIAMISFGISQSLFGDVAGSRTLGDLTNVPFLKLAWSASSRGALMSYTDIVQTYQRIRENVFSTISKTTIDFSSDVATTPVPMKTERPVSSQVITPQPAMVPVGTGGRTYRKSRRSKSSRRTKRAHRSDLSTKSERRSSR